MEIAIEYKKGGTSPDARYYYKFSSLWRFEKPLDPYDCFHVEVVDQIVGKPFVESSLTDPIENIDTFDGTNQDHWGDVPQWSPRYMMVAESGWRL